MRNGDNQQLFNGYCNNTETGIMKKRNLWGNRNGRKIQYVGMAHRVVWWKLSSREGNVQSPFQPAAYNHIV